MFTSASKINRVVKTALSVDYKIENRYETVDGVIVDWYKVTRTANKEYRYVDMTETAVIKAAMAKVAMYTRTTRKCITRTLDKTCSSLTSDVQPQRNSCGSWDLVIKVHEEDSTHSATIPADPASLFTTENQRNYDEADNGIELVSNSYWDDWESPNYMLLIDLTATVSGDLRASDVHFFIKFNGESDWYELYTGVTVEGRTARCYYEYIKDSHPDAYLKAKCGDYESNVETVTY